MHKSSRLGAIVFALFVTFTSGAAAQAQSPQKFERVLIEAPKPHTKLVSDIRALGGRVNKEFRNIDAISADIPANKMVAVRALVGPDAVSKDLIVPSPRAADPTRGRSAPHLASPVRSLRHGSASSISVIPDSGVDPYALNAANVNLNSLHKSGWTGAGIVVAVIDSGIRPGYAHIAGSVTGCENFVDDGGDGILDGHCSDASNDPHGTFVAGMIAAHARFDIAGTQILLNSVKQHMPSALETNPATNQKTILPLIGSAPGAQIYAMRVFAAGRGAPASRIMDAIDRVIELRKSGINIKVCNLSLGKATLYAGRDVFDRAVDKLLENDIVPVVSAGNVGPSSLTISSPSSSFSAIGVGAYSPSANERIYWDTLPPEFGGYPGAGFDFRPFDGAQTAYFSSRGPNADGRLDPDIVASGFANFGQGYGTPDQIDIAGGTSFSAPLVAGVAATLRQAHLGATATQVRNAIIASGNRKLIADGSGVLDQGAGLVNAKAADKLLDSGHVPDFLPQPEKPNKDVRVNIERGADLDVVRGTVTRKVLNLKPGERAEILYDVEEKTDRVMMSISHFSASATQNPVFGDDLLVTVHSAKTSAIHQFGDYRFFEFVTQGTFAVDDPETGVMRITISGDWFNAGAVSADVTVSSTKEPLPKTTAEGKIKNGEFEVFPINVPSGVKRADFRLSWKDDWSNYPTSDIDMFVVDPDGNLADVFDPRDPANPTPGATLDDPEIAAVEAGSGQTLKKGTWYIFAFGFSVPAGNDQLELRVNLDGKLLK